MSERPPAAHLPGMSLSTHEIETATLAAAKEHLAAAASLHRGETVDPEQAWSALSKHDQYRVLCDLDVVVPYLLALPAIDVAPGTQPTWTETQVREAVESTLRAEMERRGGEVTGDQFDAMTARRLPLVTRVLDHVPARQDPDRLVVPDHL